MSHDPSLSQVPEAKPEDLEDVSWALSTAKAHWARGDHADALRCVRRAAELAHTGHRTARALELARAAEALAAGAAGHAAIEIEEIEPISVREPPPVPATRAASVPPPHPSSPKLPAPSSRPRGPLGADEGIPPSARTSETRTVAVPIPFRRSRPEIGGNEPTFVGQIDDLAGSPQLGDEPRTEDGDRHTALGPAPAAPRRTSSAERSAFRDAPRAPAAGGPTHAARAGSRSAPVEPHDPAIATTQAVRVVIWRDANGVHVAPAGTVVSAITVDAVLVALDPQADLTAWLTQRGR